MSGARRVRRALVAGLLTLAALTGCASVPTSGPIKQVPGAVEGCQSCVNVEVAPPAAGTDPGQIVEGYLRATSNYQPDYAVARQFLTRAAAESWQPEDGVTIYTGQAQVDGTEVRLRGQQVGALRADRTYAATQRPIDVDFGLTQEDGEWRISKPPTGLLVADFAYERFYSGYDRYFVGNGVTLVPERVYLPDLRNRAAVAAALMKALLAGPSEWLAPAVRSAIPEDTSLSLGSVTITGDGVAEVALSENVLTQDGPARSLLGAQIVYTLQQVRTVRGVLITVNGQRFRVPEADPATGVLTTEAYSSEIEAELTVGGQSYALSGGRVHAVRTPSGEAPGLEPILGALGSGAGGMVADSLAVSVNGAEVAVATDRRTALRRARLDTGEVTTLAGGLADLLRPQFTRYGELWAIGRRDGRQQLLLFDGTEPVPVNGPALNGRTVTAFRISPDGTRMALVRRTDATGYELALARIRRGNDQVIVDQGRVVPLPENGPTAVAEITDLGWLDADVVLLIAAADEGGPRVPLRVRVDGSEIQAERGEPGWRAGQLSVLPRAQTVVVVGSKERSWRRDGGQWVRYVDGVTAVAYPG